MRYFPIFFDLKDRPVTVVGGSEEALRKIRLHADDEDPDPIRGADAISLVHRLTLESWALAGLELPAYSRSETPYRFTASRRS